MKNEENNLTERQHETLNFIYTFIIKNGFSPSLREIANGTYCSKPVAQRHLEALIDKGYITHTPNTARSIVLKKII